jgi:hypothetical protein
MDIQTFSRTPHGPPEGNKVSASMLLAMSGKGVFDIHDFRQLILLPSSGGHDVNTKVCSAQINAAMHSYLERDSKLCTFLMS